MNKVFRNEKRIDALLELFNVGSNQEVLQKGIEFYKYVVDELFQNGLISEDVLQKVNKGTLRIKINGRLSRSLGRYLNDFVNVEVSKDLVQYGTIHEVVDTVLHEFVHLVLHYQRMDDGVTGHSDGDKEFEQGLAVVGAGSSGTTSLENLPRHIYRCNHGGCEISRTRKIREVERKICSRHKEKLTYLGRMTHDEYRKLKEGSHNE